MENKLQEAFKIIRTELLKYPEDDSMAGYIDNIDCLEIDIGKRIKEISEI